MLKSKPFAKLKHPDRKEELLSRAAYLAHRLVETIHRLEKLHHEPKKYNPDTDPTVVVNSNH